MDLSFKQVLEEKKALVWPEIKTYLDNFLNFPDFCTIPKRYQKIKKLHDKIIREYPERKGKYFRPSLVLLTAQAMDYPLKKAIKTAAAMQMSEDWILTHDDVEDNSLERRGKPAIHQLYGKELAINAGDGLHVLMWQALKDNLDVVGQKLGKKIIDEFVIMLSRTVFGQTIEISWTQRNKQNMTYKDVLLILESKTAYYTIAGPMRLGAILAGATPKQLQLIYQFAKPLGYCFQIRDDLLDLTSDFKGSKKQMGNDIYEGKRTIMLIHLLKKANQNDKKRLKKILGKSRQDKSEKEVSWVIVRMKKYGSLEHGQKIAAKFASQATQLFNDNLGFLAKNPARDQLLAGIEFVLNRGH